MQILIVFAPNSVCKASCLYVSPRVWQLHFSIVIMLPDVPISHMLFSSFSTDFEYLRKSQGSVFLHNVLAKNSTEFLNKDKFVRFHSVIWSTSSPWRQHSLLNLCGCGWQIYPPPQGEKEADDYKLSADRRYVAFMSNYSKVVAFHFHARDSATVSCNVLIGVPY